MIYYIAAGAVRTTMRSCGSACVSITNYEYDSADENSMRRFPCFFSHSFAYASVSNVQAYAYAKANDVYVGVSIRCLLCVVLRGVRRRGRCMRVCVCLLECVCTTHECRARINTTQLVVSTVFTNHHHHNPQPPPTTDARTLSQAARARMRGTFSLLQRRVQLLGWRPHMVVDTRTHTIHARLTRHVGVVDQVVCACWPGLAVCLRR